MPIITFSSFGDIVAVLQLAWQLRAGLSEATGASAEIRELLIDIDSFTRTLQHIKASIEMRCTPLEPSVEHGIKHAIIACHAVLRAILIRLASFKTRMSSKVGAVAWRQYWAVTAWSILGGKKEVDALRTRLLEQLGVIQTYLALSHVNDQSAVQVVVEQQATTLDRVYSVVQDIQLRFDVGVPTFQFYNEDIGQYYQPFARTSLTRFMQLLDLHHKRKAALYKADDSDPLIVHQTLATTQNQCVMKHSFMISDYSGSWRINVDCCYFRERAFDQWQVLIGIYMPHPNTVRIFKHLLERKHAFNTACNCDGPQCKVRFREDIQRAHYVRDMGRTIHILSQIAALGMVMEEDASRNHYRMSEEILRELLRCPESYLRHTINPLLQLHVEHQRPSGDYIVRLLRNSPLSDIRIDLGSSLWPVKYFIFWYLSASWPSERSDSEAERDTSGFSLTSDAAPEISRYI